MLLRLLVASDSRAEAERIERAVSSAHILVSRCSGGDALWESLSRDSYDLIVASEDALSGEPSAVIQELRGLPERPEVIVLRHEEDPVRRARLLASGALAVLNLSVPAAVLRDTLRALIERRGSALTDRMHSGIELEPSRLSDFSSSSASMSRLLDVARRVASADATLLILGETGVGKEWLARAIHSEGPRAAHPFVAVNCAAVPEGLLESELFGHEQGAFTGSIRSRRGHFELAHRGTIFLDEISEMPTHLQAKLLRVLEERSIQRLGAETKIPVDARVMAATNRDLDRAIAEMSFRSDLFFRLSVVTLRVPPLRERPEDIEPLALGYLDRFRHQLGRPVTAIDEAALDALRAYGWPGNVRELINVMERAVLLCRGETVSVTDLPESVARGEAATAVAAVVVSDHPVEDPSWLDRPLREVRLQAVDALERRYLEAQLTRSNGNIGLTARRSGLDPRSLYDKLRRLGLRKEDFKPVAGED